MKKLKLKMQELNSPEVLTRQQLKNVLGGTGTTTTVHYYDCNVTEKSSGGATSTYTVQISGTTDNIQPHADSYCASVVNNGYAASCTANCDVTI